MSSGRCMNGRRYYSRNGRYIVCEKVEKTGKIWFCFKETERDSVFRYNSGEYLDNAAIKYNVTKLSEEEIYSLVQKEGGEQKCFVIMCFKNGIYDSLKGINEVMKEGLGGIIYFGNGVGYFQGEQYIGPPDRYILVKKQRNG